MASTVLPKMGGGISDVYVMDTYGADVYTAEFITKGALTAVDKGFKCTLTCNKAGKYRMIMVGGGYDAYGTNAMSLAVGSTTVINTSLGNGVVIKYADVECAVGTTVTVTKTKNNANSGAELQLFEMYPIK